ncbi:YitT family protein [Paenibacillus sp. MMS20-IR301]|uniref:YitT family protein n=1 Tax=Paenibacillus sp. MMS20-IR301 TaxID=2895946 RepID=UPI0028EADA9E|nr:YitT family protein [Paenibacillus sp. MMS20-IR301]WNS45843.1 YitT family protein [Paenibacillus sp. MMS20-IR301]
MRPFQKYVIILLSSLLIAAGTNFFLVPYKILDGGIIGIALIINYISGIKIGLAIVVCSVPVFLLAWFREREIFYNSIAGLLASSFLIELLGPLQYHFLYYIELGSVSSAIIGGFLMGSGLGLMLRFKASTGGTDLLAKFMRRYIPLNVGVLIFLSDAVIIGAGGLLISKETFFHSILTIAAGGVATGLCTLEQ